MLAGGHASALAAQQKRGEPSPIMKQHRFLAALGDPHKAIVERFGENGAAARGEFAAQV